MSPFSLHSFGVQNLKLLLGFGAPLPGRLLAVQVWKGMHSSFAAGQTRGLQVLGCAHARDFWGSLRGSAC